MKKAFKRILATIMTVVMILTAIPFAGIKSSTIFAPKASAKDISSYSVGDIITFGSYPQSKVTDSATISALDSISKTWISYGYYSGTGEWADGQMKPLDYMKYCDISYNGNKYRAVTFSSYRPNFTSDISSIYNSVQSDNGYYTGNVYYFRYDPLTWCVLSPLEGYVMCTMAIDAQAYNNYLLFEDRIEYGEDNFVYGNSSKTYFASDWANSSLRMWLNDDFYNVAFTSEEKSLINTTYNQNKCVYRDSWFKQFDSVDTNDKIFLITFKEALAVIDYFGGSTIKPTDYAKCQGCEQSSDMGSLGNSSWLLRSNLDDSSVAFVYYDGYVVDFSKYSNVNLTNNGIVPALKINPQSTICDTHSYSSAVTLQPTSTTDGVRTYTCSCGDSYTEPITKLGHNYTTSVTAATCTTQGYTTHTCSRCGDNYKDTYTAVVAHKYGSWITDREPTATVDGEKHRICSVCGNRENGTIPATGEVHTHSYTSKVTTPATCTTNGVRTYTCSCGDSYTETITKTGHSLTHMVISATCTVDGMEYDLCLNCGNTFNSTVIPKSHKFKHVKEDSTCSKTGKEYDVCTVCGTKANETVVALKAHTYKHMTVASTCSVAGMEYDLCTVCGATANSKTLPLKAHTWGEWVRTKEPTTTQEGTDTRKCSVCGKTETRTVEKLKALVDTKTGVEIIYDDEYDSGVKITVSEVFDGTSFQLINANYGEVKSTIFDISTVKDGNKVQPKDEVKVRIPVPADYKDGNLFVVYVDTTNGTTTKIPVTVVDGYAEFVVNHFSYYALVSQSKNKVNSVKVDDISLNYKKSTTLKPTIDVDSGVKYTVKYESSNPKVATVDDNGKVTATKRGKGSATITCTVTDEFGNTVKDTCNVNVSLTFGQKLIVYVLFGWIWY